MPKNETLGGLTPPLNYVRGKPAVISCWTTEVVARGTITVRDAQPTCVPKDKVAALYAAFK